MAIYQEPGGPAVCQVVIPCWANFLELRVCELRIKRILQSSQNPIQTNFAEFLFHALR
jgi:hypothetical protein